MSFSLYINSAWTLLRSFEIPFPQTLGLLQLTSPTLPIICSFTHIFFISLRFISGRTYQYCACLFGLSRIPQVFSELCSPVKAFARQTWSCIVFQYIYNWLFASPDATLNVQITHLFIHLCLHLGLSVNLDKSHITQTQHLCHLCVQFDFQLALVRPPADKLLNIGRITAQLLHTSEAPIILLRSLMG